MATVKVKLRNSTVKGKAGVIYYQLCHRQESKQITTKLHLLPHQWNAEEELPLLVMGNKLLLEKSRQQIENDVWLLKRIIRELDNRRGDYTLSDVITMYHSSATRVTVLSFIEKQIVHLKASRKLGTARNYQRTLNSFSALLNGGDISFALLNEGLVMEYNDWLQRRKVMNNSISFYMRTLRAVYNKAVKQHLVEQSFPFRDVYTGVDRTRKRAVSEEVVVQLQKMDLRFSHPLTLARDLFIFSYCTRGMAFVDMAFLCKQDIVNGMITYTRHKTGQRLVVRVEPCIEYILKHYETATRESPYVFPILSSNDPEEAYRQYQTALGYHNRKLKRLAGLTGVEIPFSSYTPRHTWATTARNHNVPLSVISAGMGHTSEKTTQIYLASLENSVIDQANRGILEKLNFGVSL